jgi:DNA-binding NarL/FixJ family response regulator
MLFLLPQRHHAALRGLAILSSVFLYCFWGDWRLTANEHIIRIVIVEDHRLCRESLSLALDLETFIEIVAEAVTGLQAIEMISELKPDIVLVGITLPESDGLQIISAISERSPASKPIIMTGGMDEENIIKAVKAGAKGYLSKNSSISDLLKAVKAVYNGQLWVERQLIAKYFNGDIAADSGLAKSPQRINELLTPREQETLRILITGATNKEIARQLFICEKTVKSHLNSIFKKLNVHRRLEAILWAIKHGF